MREDWNGDTENLNLSSSESDMNSFDDTKKEEKQNCDSNTETFDLLDTNSSNSSSESDEINFNDSKEEEIEQDLDASVSSRNKDNSISLENKERKHSKDNTTEMSSTSSAAFEPVIGMIIKK